MSTNIKTPFLIGTRKWTITNNSIKSLMGGRNFMHLVINFYRDENLPGFGITALPVKELFWELGNKGKAYKSTNYMELEIEEKAHKSTNYILHHQWNKNDSEYWEDRKYAIGESVVLSIQYDPMEAGKIKVIFEHKNTVSGVYKFRLCPVQQDAYLVFFAPLSRFRKSKSLQQSNPLAILTIRDFLDEYFERINQGYQDNKLAKDCIACCNEKADIVFIQCGHCAFCEKCIKSYKENKCPLCNNTTVSGELPICKIRMPSNHCLVCPAKFNCREVDCMVIPCGCVLGCTKYTERAIIPGDKCINCNEIVSKLMKVYVRE